MESYRAAFEKWKRVEGAYRKIRDEVNGWSPPTKDHEELKKFMLSQLETGWPTMYSKPPELLSGKEWRAAQIKSAEWDIEYHTKELEKENERVWDRGGWLIKLVESVGDPE
jgi:hypothetical protein